jgi:hypothetical protein
LGRCNCGMLNFLEENVFNVKSWTFRNLLLQVLNTWAVAKLLISGTLFMIGLWCKAFPSTIWEFWDNFILLLNCLVFLVSLSFEQFNVIFFFLSFSF